jgi:xanthine dehydrogenase accessory factor
VPFVLARVVLAERPTSAKPGDEALILGDGTIEGFVGGTCAEATIRERALWLLDSGEPLVVRITASAEEPLAGGPAAVGPGRAVVRNPCLSGGTVEIFLEPNLPPPLVVVAGQAPIATALMAVGQELGYHLQSFTGNIPSDALALVVASHGRGEDALLTSALECDVPYVALVASRTRGRAVVNSLDLPADRRQRVRTPAGLDIGARTPGEIAVSILAEIIATRPRRPVRAAPATWAAIAGVDPVCGMSVAATLDALHLEVEGRSIWFCGPGCLQAFRADPAAYST